MKLALLLASSLATAFAEPVLHDVVVYGGTSGGDKKLQAFCHTYVKNYLIRLLP